MRIIAHRLKAISQGISYIAIAVVAILAFPIFYDALARKAGYPTIWVFEVSQYSLIAAAFLPNAVTLANGNHFRVQILVSAFPTIKHAFDRLALVSTLIFGVVIAVGGGVLVHYSFVNSVNSASLLDVPLYLPQLFILLGGVTLVLQSAAMLILRESPSENTEFE
jgi:C4-dicarboxylate transporter DctQ subunit